MKKFLCCLAFVFSQNVLAQSPGQDYQQYPTRRPTTLPSVHTIQVKQEPMYGEFFFKPYLSIEYNAPRVVHSGVNSSFKNNGTIFHQVGDLRNIALGGNFRVHKFLGVNANWVQSELVNSELKGVSSLSERAYFNVNQYNLSGLFYVPVVDNLFEIFAEGGVSDIQSKLTYTTSDGTAYKLKSHQTAGLYGAGFQITLNEMDTIRFSWQRYTGKIGLINSDYSTTRIGYLHAF